MSWPTLPVTGHPGRQVDRNKIFNFTWPLWVDRHSQPLVIQVFIISGRLFITRYYRSKKINKVVLIELFIPIRKVQLLLIFILLKCSRTRCILLNRKVIENILLTTEPIEFSILGNLNIEMLWWLYYFFCWDFDLE